MNTWSPRGAPDIKASLAWLNLEAGRGAMTAGVREIQMVPFIPRYGGSEITQQYGRALHRAAVHPEEI